MSIEFHDTDRRLSIALRGIAAKVPPDGLTLGQLLEQLGEQGLLLLCIILTLPNLSPVTIPGVSTVFGAAITLIGVGVLFNRVPWLPKRVVTHHVQREHLLTVFDKGTKLFERIERLVKPRILVLTHGATINRLNGVMLVAAGLLLVAPLSLIPFSNPLPAAAALFLAVGILQRDGLAIILGWLMVLVTTVYFGGILYGALKAGQFLLN